MIKKKMLFLIIAAGVACCSSAGEWVGLFDGETLDGWVNPYEWGEAAVTEGEIRLKADRKFFLCSQDEYDDFVFEAEVKMPDGKSNSGFMFRAGKQKNKVYGYQAEVDTTARAWSGGIYGESFGGWRFQPRKPNDSPAGQAFRTATKGSFKRYDWNKYRIECAGNRVRIFVNGVLCSDYFDDSRDSGVVALQHHGESGKVYRFRNIRIKEIDPDSYLGADSEVVLDEGLDSGKMADAWNPTDPDAWKVEKVDGSHVLSLHSESDYKPETRSPRSILWLTEDGPDSFLLDVIAKSTEDSHAHRDLCLFFGKQDESHFYYVHIAQNADPHAHSIFAVDGSPRVSIATERTEGIDWGDDWHRVRVVRDAESGAIRVYFDDLEEPIMVASDKRFSGGAIGVGSFDNTGYFDDIRIVEMN